MPKSSRVSAATVDSGHEEDEVDKNFVDEFREEQLDLEAKEKEEEGVEVEVEEEEEQEEEEGKETEAVVTKKVIKVIPVRVDTRREQVVKGGGVEGEAVEVKRDLRELLSKSKENKRYVCVCVRACVCAHMHKDKRRTNGCLINALSQISPAQGLW